LPYEFLAGVVVVIHLLFVLFVVLGGLLVLRWPKAAYVHLPAAAWGAAIEFAGFICPLTPLENSLRRQAGASTYTAGFIEHYLLPVLYPAGLTRTTQLVLGVMVIGINVAIYAWVGRTSRRIH
jgi:hypothetical protein